jgi:hypothetical protein
MLPAEQVAKSLGLELTEEALFLDLKGRGHFFKLTIDGTGVLVDGINLEVTSWPVRYKHQRYYLDVEVVNGVIEGVLNPEKIDVLFDMQLQANFRIQNIYLEEHLPLQAPDAQHAVTQKLIHTALKLDPALFKYEVESIFDSGGVVINLQCEQSNDLAEACQIATKMGNEFHKNGVVGKRTRRDILNGGELNWRTRSKSCSLEQSSPIFQRPK